MAILVAFQKLMNTLTDDWVTPFKELFSLSVAKHLTVFLQKCVS